MQPPAQRRPRRGAPAPPPRTGTPGSPPSSPRAGILLPAYAPHPDRASQDPTPFPSPRGAPLLPRPLPRVLCYAPLPRHSLPTPRTPPSAVAALWGAPRGARSRRPAGSGRRSWGTRVAVPALPAGTGSPYARRESGAHRGSHPTAGLDPVTASARSRRPWARNRHRAGLCSHLGYKIEPAPEAWGASPVAPGRAQQAGRSLLSKTPGWSRERPVSLCPRCPGWRKSHRAGAAFATGRTSFPPAVFELPQATRPEKCEAL